MRRFCCWHLIGAALVLTIPVWAQSPKEQKPAAAPATGAKDAFGDPLPPGALARIGTLRFRMGETYSFQPQMSPDGKLLAAAGPLGQIELWELPAWIPRKPITVARSYWQSIAFTPDSKQIVAFDQQQQTFHLIDLATGKLTRSSNAMPVKPGPESAQSSPLIVSRDQQTVFRQSTTFGKDRTQRIIVWDLAKNEARESLTIPTDRTGPRVPLAFSADGRHVAQVTRKLDPDRKSKGDYGIETWSLITGKLETKWKTDRPISQLAFAPDGQTLATSDAQGIVRVHDGATGKTLHTFAASKSRISHVEFAPDGKALLVASQAGVERFDPVTGMKSSNFKAPIPVGARQFAFLPDGKVLALAMSGRAFHFWEATTGQLFSPKGVPTAAISDVRFTPDHRLFVACENGSAASVESARGAKLHDLKLDSKNGPPSDGYLRNTRAFALSPSTDFVVSTSMGFGQLELFDTKSGKQLFGEQANDDEFFSCFFDADRKIAIASGKTVHIRDPRNGKEFDRLELPLQAREHFVRIAVSPSGKQIAASTSDENIDFDRVVLWDRDKKKMTREWRFQNDGGTALQFSPDDRWLALGDGTGNALLVDVGRGGRDHTLALSGRPGEDVVTELAFTADGRQLACAIGLPYSGNESSRIYVFELASKKIRLELPGHAAGMVRRLAFSPDGSLLASGASDTTVLVWQAGLRAFANTPAARAARPDELNDWFAKLAEPDAKAAFQAMIKLAQTPAQAVKLFEGNIKPARTPDLGSRTIPQLIQDLGSDTFTVRTKANQTLQKLGATAEPHLREALQGTNLEARRRVEILLDRIVNHDWTADEIRHARAVEVLQTIAFPAARALLTRWADGDPTAILTVEARKALP